MKRLALIIPAFLLMGCTPVEPNGDPIVTTQPTPSVVTITPTQSVSSAVPSQVPSWPSEAAKAKFLEMVALAQPELADSQESVNALTSTAIATCEFLDEAGNTNPNDSAVAMAARENAVKLLGEKGITDTDRAATIVMNASIVALCPDHIKYQTIAVVPESTP